MKSVGTFEVKTQSSALVEAVQHGETILVTKNGKPVAQLGPMADQAAREFGFDRDLFASRAIRIADDFDDLPPDLLSINAFLRLVNYLLDTNAAISSVRLTHSSGRRKSRNRLWIGGRHRVRIRA